MFKQRDKRVARRQRALEELLWLDPVERERRIVAAVAAGDFSADEVDASLRLIARLDMLRGMDLPRGGRLIGTVGSSHDASLSSDEIELGIVAAAPEDGGADDDNSLDDRVAIPIVAEPVEVSIEPDYVGIPIAPETTGELDGERTLDAGVPLDALESNERWDEPSQRVAASPVLARRAAEAPVEWDMPAEDGQLPPAEDAGPSISWLRPN